MHMEEYRTGCHPCSNHAQGAIQYWLPPLFQSCTGSYTVLVATPVPIMHRELYSTGCHPCSNHAQGAIQYWLPPLFQSCTGSYSTGCHPCSNHAQGGIQYWLPPLFQSCTGSYTVLVVHAFVQWPLLFTSYFFQCIHVYVVCC